MEVELPDGRILEFPAGTSQDVMRAAIQRLLASEGGQPAPEPAPAPQPAPVTQDPLLPSPDTDTRSTQEYLRDTGAELPLVDTSMIGRPRPQPTGGGMAMDVLRSGAGGLARGATELALLPDTLGNLISRGVTGAVNVPLRAMGFEGVDYAPSPIGASVREGVAEFTSGGSQYEPQTTAGEFAQTIGEFAGGGAGPRLAVVAGTGSELAGQMTEGTAAEPWARAAGALLAPPAVAATQRGVQRMVSPMAGQLDAARQQAVQTLRDAGVRPTAGQVVGGTAAQNQLYREASTAAGRQLADDALEDFTSAALRTIGTDARRATPDVMEEATRRIGAVFDDVVRGVDVNPAPADISRFGQAIDTFAELAPRETAPPLFSNIQRALIRSLDQGEPIAASTVSSWRSNLSKLTTSNDAATRDAARSALEAIDDVINTSLVAAGRTDAVQQLAQARNQYRNLLAIERAAQRSSDGLLTPAQLRTALLQQGRRRYVQGQGDLGPLTRAGNEVLESLPQSGTQPRTLASQLTSGASGGTASGLGALGLGADPLLATGVGLAATAAPMLRNQFLSMPIGQRYFLNQMMPQAGPVLSGSNALRSAGGIVAGGQQ